MSICVITPSRGRPAKAFAAYESFLRMRSPADSVMNIVVDTSDPANLEYRTLGIPVIEYEGEGGGMGAPLNKVAADLAPMYDILGFVGDDHRFRSKDWDVPVSQALARGGIAYGDDLSRPDLPTQVFISSDIVQALGWMCLPGAKHLYLDDTWRYLGNEADCLYFLPQVIIEHVHPAAGKGTMDEGYARVNHPDIYSHDGTLFREWIESGQAAKDVMNVRTVLGSR
jgi:hypothetical protein